VTPGVLRFAPILNGFVIAIDFISVIKNVYDLVMGKENETEKQMKVASREIENSMKDIENIINKIKKNQESQNIVLSNVKNLLEKYKIYLKIEKLRIKDDIFEELLSYLSLKFLVTDKNDLEGYFKRLALIEINNEVENGNLNNLIIIKDEIYYTKINEDDLKFDYEIDDNLNLDSFINIDKDDYENFDNLELNYIKKENNNEKIDQNNYEKNNEKINENNEKINEKIDEKNNEKINEKEKEKTEEEKIIEFDNNSFIDE
jgi:hypothetical protein